ncbi:unnamed protein product [Urochloa humidicola]
MHHPVQTAAPINSSGCAGRSAQATSHHQLRFRPRRATQRPVSRADGMEENVGEDEAGTEQTAAGRSAEQRGRRNGAAVCRAMLLDRRSDASMQPAAEQLHRLPSQIHQHAARHAEQLHRLPARRPDPSPPATVPAQHCASMYSGLHAPRGRTSSAAGRTPARPKLPPPRKPTRHSCTDGTYKLAHAKNTSRDFFFF